MHAEAAMNACRSNPPQSLGWVFMMFLLFPQTVSSPPVSNPEAEDERSRADSAKLPETRAARERMVQEQIFARGIRGCGKFGQRNLRTHPGLCGPKAENTPGIRD